MSGFYGDNQNQNYGWGEYNMGEDADGFQQDNMGFQSFDYGGAPTRPDSGAPSSYLQPDPAMYAGSVLTPEPTPQFQEGPAGEFDQEPPLLEELGINPDHIMQKHWVLAC
ncbi:protein YIPF5-like [Pollicipes pollicipes]|uniref:protein YIPF5-like n=1 Tax=Pollicipes pollicipes TaxID=41117 RepID=UPI00188499D4|nr:protein YIPF5-like [Pollicipes pollicipes]